MGNKQNSFTNNYSTFMYEFDQRQLLMFPPSCEQIFFTFLMAV